jgi:hypothetical protein
MVEHVAYLNHPRQTTATSGTVGGPTAAASHLQQPQHQALSVSSLVHERVRLRGPALTQLLGGEALQPLSRLVCQAHECQLGSWRVTVHVPNPATW